MPSAKGFAIKPKPKPVKASASDAGDAWVANRTGPEPKKRLVLDIPASLHIAIKARCAQRQSSMVDEITQLLQREFK
jgi:hypothetical protein